MINKIKKLKLPMIIGLILAGVDLAFWIWFAAYGFLNYRPGIFHEGLLGMMILHTPSSILLPILGSLVLAPFLTSDSILPQTFFLFVVGIGQYYFVGYFIGWLIVKLRRKLGFDKSVPEPQKKQVPSRKKDWIYNILHLLFTVLILQMLIDILSGMMLDFEMYKMNYPPTRHYLELALAIIWFYCTYRIVRYNKKKFDNNEIFKNTNKTLLFANILIVIIFSAVHIPKLSISDIPEATGLDSVYARQQAGIFFDNPLERLIIMKTVIVGMDEKTYQVAAYTLFGLQYRLTDIEKVSEYEIRLLLNPGMAKRQFEGQVKIASILDRIQHLRWPRVTFVELTRNSRFNSRKLQNIVPGIEQGNSLFLRTDYNEHEVYLLVYVEDTFTNHFRNDSFVFEDTGPHPKYIINSKDIKISDAHSDSVFDSYRIDFEGRPYFMIFEIVSDQKPPADFDYVGWIPDHNITEDDILFILNSIAGPKPK